MPRLLSLFALLALFCFATACTPGRGNSDDDDATGDDDDSASDDDDATGDDDDATGDDDDATGDDDDATGDDDDATLVEGNSVLAGIFSVSYWSDMDATLAVCQQAYLFDGASETRVGVLGNSCPLCTAKIDVTNIVDISSSGPTAGTPLEAYFNSVVTLPCVPAQHFVSGQDDFGAVLSSTTISPGGDWLGTQGLIDGGTGVAAGMGVVLGGDTFATIRDAYAGKGATVTHVGYVNEANNGALTGVGLDGVSVEAGAGTGYWPFWIYFTQSGATDGRFIGSYGIGSPWRLTQEGGTDYQAVTFGGTLIGQ